MQGTSPKSLSVGVIGLGLLAVRVLSASASYAVAEAVNWQASLSYKLKRAHGFYGVIAIAMLLGLLINFVGIDPIQAPIVTAVIDGVVTVSLILPIARIAANSKMMGDSFQKVGSFRAVRQSHGQLPWRRNLACAYPAELRKFFAPRKHSSFSCGVIPQPKSQSACIS